MGIITHGYSRTPTYHAWANMKARCNNPNASAYKNYGGRGIKVCDEWNESFHSFLNDMGEKPNGLTLDRIDVNGNYEKDNCRWLSTQGQSNNRRDTVWVEIDGASMSIAQASELLGVPYERARWAVERYGKQWLDYAKSDSAGEIQFNNTSGYKGVSFHKASGLYHARLYINRSSIKSLGYYATAEQANESVVRAAADIGRKM